MNNLAAMNRIQVLLVGYKTGEEAEDPAGAFPSVFSLV